MKNESFYRVLEVYTSVGGAEFLKCLLNEWENCGWRVYLRSAVREEEYRSKNGLVRRAMVRWKMYVGYGLRCVLFARARNDGIRVVSTNPFYLPALFSLVSREKAPVVNLLYDLFPEALIQGRGLKANSWLARRIGDITRYAFRECAVTVFLGGRIRAYAEATYGPARRAVVIPVGADGRVFRGKEPEQTNSYSRQSILYCGNLGRMHEIDTILAAFPSPAARSFVWRFHVGRASCLRLRREVGRFPNVQCEGALVDSAWHKAMLDAPIGLVTIARGGEKVVMPSKAYSALVAGQAILAVCVRESDLADLVFEHDCGWVVEPGDSTGLVALLERLSADPSEILIKRRNAYKAGHSHYDMATVAKQWLALFHDLESVQPSKLSR